jgi:hypothetical protein
MRRLPLPLLRHNKAVSYAISAVIITAVTVSLVIAVSMYAYQVLEQQRGAAEYDVTKKSILAFDDSVQDVAWKLNASRMVRFKIEFGTLKLLSNAQTLNLSATVGNSSENYPLGSVSSALTRYSIGTTYVTLGEDYQSHILGNESLIVAGSTESLGRVLIEQGFGSVNVTLSYRARAIRTSVIEVNGTMVNYVTTWLIKIVTESSATHIRNFDLRARCIDIETNTFGPYNVTDTDYCTINVESEGETSSAQIGLDEGKVVFSVVVAEVRVGV